MPDLRKRSWISRLCNGGLLVIACGICAGLLLLNICFRTHISQKEVVTVQVSLLRSAAILVLTAVAVVVAGLLPQKLQIPEKKCFLIWTAIYTVMALYLILNVDTTLRDDAKLVHLAALDFLDGNYDKMAPDHYMGYYPYQTGLMLYDALVYRFGKNGVTPFLANFCFVLGIQYLIWQIADTVFQSRPVNLVTMGLSFAFLPQFFFILFVYGTIPGLFFMLLAFYNGLRFSRTGSWRRMLVTALSCGAAVILRKNNLIGMIALVIFLFLRALEKERKGRFLTAVCLTVLCTMVINQQLLSAVEAKTGQNLHDSMPSSLFIAMGTDLDNNQVRGPGWYNRYTIDTLKSCDYDREAAAKIGWQKVAENLKDTIENPARAFRFYGKKLVSTWCDSQFQSIWSGPMERMEQYVHTRLLRSIYQEGIADKLLNLVCKCVVLPIWLFASVFLLVFHRKNRDWELFYLYLIGGALFHFVWETKSQYVYPYVFCLIPFAAFAFVQTARKCGGIVRRFRRKK